MKRVKKEYFPISQLELRKEISHHPDLVEMLLHNPAPGLDRIDAIKFASSYCSMPVDGWFAGKDLCELERRITYKLRTMSIKRVN